MTNFNSPSEKQEQELGESFRPKFDTDGLISTIVCDHETNEVLMFAFMNNEALTLTIKTGEAYYWSRSRSELWHKGATSGNVQKVKEIRTDCDQDVILLKVEMAGAEAACHTGRVSCFYRIVDSKDRLRFDGTEPLFDPEKVYKDKS